MTTRRALFAGMIATAGLAMLPAEAAETAEVVIDPQHPGHPIDPRFFGSNLQWEKDGDGARTPHGWAPGLLDQLRASRVASLRFPGGDLANTYRWKHGIGMHDKRIAGLNYGGKSEASSFGTDEFIALCRQAQLEPVITVNPTAGADEAADWVEYLNGGVSTTWGARRAANGSAQPLNAPWWEVGNETFNPKQPGFAGAEDYARRFLAYRRAMKARDPNIRVGLVLEGTFLQAAWMASVYPHMPTWNEAVLKVAGSEADFVSVHFYTPHDKVWRDAELHRIVMSGSSVLSTNLDAIRALLKRHARPDTPILLSEYGLAFADKFRPSDRIASTESGLFAASLLLHAMAEPQVVRTHHWSLLNNSAYGSLVSEGDTLKRRPVFDAIAAMATLAPGRWLPVRITGPVYEVRAIGNIAASSNVPVVEAGATLQADGSMRVALVNRSPDKTVRVALRAGAGRGNASAQLLAGGEVAAEAWRASKPVLPVNTDRWELELPAASIATVTLAAGKGAAR